MCMTLTLALLFCLWWTSPQYLCHLGVALVKIGAKEISLDDFLWSLYNAVELKGKGPVQGVITHLTRSRLDGCGRHSCCHLSHCNILCLLWRCHLLGSRLTGSSVIMEVLDFASWNFSIVGTQWLGLLLLLSSTSAEKEESSSSSLSSFSMRYWKENELRTTRRNTPTKEKLTLTHPRTGKWGGHLH